MRTKKIFFIVLMAFSSTLFSQTLRDAVKKTTNEQFDEADALFKTLIQNQPSNGDIYFYYGESYFKNDNLEMANNMYQKAVEVNATNPFGYVGLGKVQWYKGKQTEAKANFFKAITLAKTYDYKKELDLAISIGNGGSTKAKYKLTSEATVLIKIAEAYINADNKNVPEAVNLLAQAVKLEPYNPEIYITRGDAYLEQNDGSKAIEDYENAATMQLDSDPRKVKAILRQGQLYNRSRNYPLALDFYKKASLIDSTFAPAYREKAEIYFRAGQYNNASAQYKRYLELNNDCAARGRYAGFLNQAKQFAQSIEAAKEALKCDPNNVYLYRYLAYDYYDSPTPDYVAGLQSSNTFFAKADTNVKIIPQDYEYHAKLLSKNGNDSLALLDYEKLLQMNPENIDLYSDIASSYSKMKNYPKAIEYYTKKIEAKKANINDYFGLGRVYYFSKDFVNADSAFSQIIKVQPDLGIGYLWRAKANSQLDPKNEKWLAKPFYEQYITKIKPEDSEKNKKDLIDAYTYMGVYYMNHKDFKTAKTYFQKVLDLDPKNSNGLKFMESPEAKKIN